MKHEDSSPVEEKTSPAFDSARASFVLNPKTFQKSLGFQDVLHLQGLALIVLVGLEAT